MQTTKMSNFLIDNHIKRFKVQTMQNLTLKTFSTSMNVRRFKQATWLSSFIMNNEYSLKS